MSNNSLKELFQIIEKRKESTSKDSYVKSLLEGGSSRINEKVLEECLELLEATSDLTADKRQKVIHESADLWFHTMVLLSNEGIDLEAVLEELETRLGTSGHAEKASREKTDKEK